MQRHWVEASNKAFIIPAPTRHWIRLFEPGYQKELSLIPMSKTAKETGLIQPHHPDHALRLGPDGWDILDLCRNPKLVFPNEKWTLSFWKYFFLRRCQKNSHNTLMYESLKFIHSLHSVCSKGKKKKKVSFTCSFCSSSTPCSPVRRCSASSSHFIRLSCSFLYWENTGESSTTCLLWNDLHSYNPVY